MQKTPCSRDEYDKNLEIQKILTKFKLDKDSFWGLILYLYDYVSDAISEKILPVRIAPIESPEQTSEETIKEVPHTHHDNITKFIESMKGAATINVTSKRGDVFTLQDRYVIKYLNHLLLEYNNLPLASRDKNIFTKMRFEEADHDSVKERTMREESYHFANMIYSFVKEVALIDRKRENVITNKEKNLILNLLVLFGYYEENITKDKRNFDKLMDTFKDKKLPPSIKYTVCIPIQ